MRTYLTATPAFAKREPQLVRFDSTFAPHPAAEHHPPGGFLMGECPKWEDPANVPVLVQGRNKLGSS